MLKILALAMILAFSACQKNKAENENISPSPATSPIQTLNQLPTRLDLPIRKIDFKNFTFPWTKKQKIDEVNFTLESGEKKMTDKSNGASLNKVEYGDVTNDGKEEAMINISPETSGNCQCDMVFVYTLENNEPKLLWNFDTWDRAQGGFKRAYAENGKLIIELFGDDKFENGEWEFNFPKKIVGYCCPTAYTKIRFKWNGEKFAVEGKPELFDYDWKRPNNETH